MNQPVKFRNLIAVFLLLSLCFAGIAAADDQQITECNGQPCADNCLFIKCDLSSAEGQAVAAEVKPYVLEDFSGYTPGQMLIMTPEGMSVADAVLYYGSLPGVVYAEPNYLLQIPDEEVSEADTENGLLLLSSTGNEATNDPFFDKQWGLNKMNVPAAWEINRGSKDVVVAVIDTGINYNHEDLADNMWINTDDPVNGQDDDNNGYIDDYYGYNFVNNDASPLDDNGHGTHCAGIIGAVGNNGIGISGVAQNVRLMAVKAGDSAGRFYSEPELKALYYAADNGANIINISFGSYGGNQETLMDAIRYAENKGVLVVCAAGNDANNNDSYPARPSSCESDNILAVAALDSTDSLSSYSCYGKVSVDVAAPGGDDPLDPDGIYSTGHSASDSYVYMCGTSMAAPMVSGVAALLLSENLELTPVELKCILMGSVTRDNNLTDKVVTGGKVNARNALDNIATPYRLVTFSDGYGKEVGSQVIISGSKVDEPADPVHYFKIFDGWYTEADGGTAWNFDNKITENMTLYAHWTADTSKEIDTSWYYDYEDKTVYTLTTAAQLRGLSYIIYECFPDYSEDKKETWAFSGKTIELGNNIDLGGENWVPIAFGPNKVFFGNFNGNGHTISNFSVDLPNESIVGFIGNTRGDITNLILSENSISGYKFVGGVVAICNGSIRNVSVNAKNISGTYTVGGIAGECNGNISDCSVIVQNISVGTNNTTSSSGGAIGIYHAKGTIDNTADAESGNTAKNIFVSVNGNVVGGAIGKITVDSGKTEYNATLENILVTGNLLYTASGSEDMMCGGIVGFVMNSMEDPINISVKNCVSLLKEIAHPEISGRIFSGATVGSNINLTYESCYGWEGTVNSRGTAFEPSKKNGENVSSDSVWNNQKFFEDLGWDFNGIWKMNAGNSNFRLPVLQNTIGTGKLNAAYMAPQRTSSSSVTAFFGEKDGSDFTFKRAVVITKATLPGATCATVTNTSGSGWYTCNLTTDSISGNGVLYFQVPLDVIDIKGYTVNDVSLIGCRTTYLSSDNQYAYYSAVITKDGALTIDFEKGAAAEAVETVQEVVEQKQTATEQKQAAAEMVQEVVEQKQTATEQKQAAAEKVQEIVEQKQTAAKSPFPVLGILAGLGIAGLAALRRK